MIFKAGYFSFHIVNQDNLELLRQWRNSEFVRSKMIHRDTITKEEQLKWYQSINNINNLYYVAHFKNEPFAMVNFKNIQWEQHTAEAGVFVGNETYLSTETPALGGLLLSFFTLNALGFIKLTSKTLAENLTASSYNSSLGYTISENDGTIIHWNLLRDNFNKKSIKLMKAVKVLSGFDDHWKMEMNENDFQIGLVERLQQRLKSNNVSCFENKNKAGHFDIHFPIVK